MKVKDLTDKISDHFTNIIQLGDYVRDGYYNFNAYVIIKDGNVSLQAAQLSTLNNNQLLGCKAYVGDKNEG